MKATGEMIIREVAGERLLIPVGETALRLHGMITLSETGLLIWQQLQQDCTEDALVSAILAEYDIDEATARQDVRAFLEQLSSLDLLQR